MPIMECHEIPQTKKVAQSIELTGKPSTRTISFTTGMQAPLEQNMEEI